MQGTALKPPLWQVLKLRFKEAGIPALRFLHIALLQSCIQMDIDADDHSEKRIAFSGMDAHIVQMVVIEYTVINPFAGSTVVVNFLIFIRSPWHRSIEPDVPFRFCVDTPAISRGRTIFLAGTGIHFATGKGTAPFTGMLLLTIAPVDHTETGHAQRRTVFVDRDGIRNGNRPAAVSIKVDEGTDAPFFAKSICGIVVIGRIQAEVTDRDIRVDGFKFTQGDNGGDAVMPPGIYEADMERKVNPDVRVMGAEHVKGMAEIKSFLVAVPSPVSIGVGEVARAGATGDTIFRTVTDFMPVRGGMGMDTGAVAGKDEAVCRDKPVFQGGDEGGETENLLESFFIMEWKLLMGEGVSSDEIGDAGMFIGKFLSSAGLFRRFFVFVSGKKVLPAGFLGSLRLGPEPVHEVKIRAKWRQGIRGASNEGSEKAVGPEFLYPDSKAGNAEHYHENKRADDLGLVYGGPAYSGIESRKIIHDGIQIKHTEFIAYRTKLLVEP